MPLGDPRPRLARATRFFARLHSFDLECPRCGTVYQIRVMPKFSPPKSRKPWDPWTARFKCTTVGCGRSYILGIVAWPAGSNAGRAPAEDQVPTPRQVSEMRREGGGWWMPEEERIHDPRPGETNLTTENDRRGEEEE